MLLFVLKILKEYEGFLIKIHQVKFKDISESHIERANDKILFQSVDTSMVIHWLSKCAGNMQLVDYDIFKRKLEIHLYLEDLWD